MATGNIEQIRELARISFVPKKPFETLPASEKVRELVRAVRKFKLVKKSRKIKFNPINVNWKLHNYGNTVKRTGKCHVSNAVVH